jgi:hypothetical protein
MKTSAFVVILSLSLIACATAETPNVRLLGRYAPPALDAGISLTLLEKDVFLADWWGQEQKHGKILGGWVSGRWCLDRGGRLVLHYVSKDKKQSEAVFTVREADGRIILKLTSPEEFPFVTFFGDEYPKEEAPNKSADSTPSAGTSAAEQPRAPASAASHL